MPFCFFRFISTSYFMFVVNSIPLIEVMKRWIPSNDEHILLYPELVNEEIKSTILKGKWWSWLPSWAHPLKLFRDEVSKIAFACKTDRESMAKRILDICSSPEEYLCLGTVDHTSVPVESWWIAQSIDSWIFYELRPTLFQISLLELDGNIN